MESSHRKPLPPPDSLTPGQRMRQEELKEKLKERSRENFELLKAKREEEEEEQSRVVDDLEERYRRKIEEMRALVRKINNPL
ncbi:hypothetical protein PHISP_00660 [Aspergillus sp. HF37]|nr:hypothetical protein PHISP_00660 [Aspergillus sp. HF37]